MRSKGKDLKNQAGNNSPSFKGGLSNKISFTGGLSLPEERLSLAHRIIDRFTEENSIADTKNADSLYIKLADQICDLYGINKASKASSNVRHTIEISQKPIGKAITADLSKGMDMAITPDVKEHVFDTSFAAPFWLVITLLEKASKQGRNLDNFEITNKDLSARENQKTAIELMTSK